MPIKWIVPVLLALMLSLSSCYSLGYYAHSVSGQIELLLKRQPIRDLVASRETPPDVRAKLQSVLEVREFATSALGLPQNESYLSYSNIGRKFVVWNVFATPEFSLTPLQWCFPFAGCNGYVGFFSEARARDSASQLAEGGNDVFVGGVPAYSTLGWFSDPVLNTMLSWDRSQLASFVFHELAHQRLYIPDDSKFNEAFATTVAKLGVKEWLVATHDTASLQAFEQQLQREEAFVTLVMKARAELESLYSRPLRSMAMREEKRRIMASLMTSYTNLRNRWGGYRGYDSWINSGLNNAKISSVVTYHHYETAFERLFKMAGHNFPEFYALTARLGILNKQRRELCLSGLASFPQTVQRHCPSPVLQALRNHPTLEALPASTVHSASLF